MIYEAVDDETLHYDVTVNNFSLRTICSMRDGLQIFSCICDKQEVAQDQDGIQIIVLDPLTNTYVDTSVWVVSESGEFFKI